MASDNIQIRPALKADLPQINEIYNHYVRDTPITFDLVEMTMERRRAWFQQFGDERHRLLVAERRGRVAGYAGTFAFRARAAYDTTVETTIYCTPEETGRGIGTRLYQALFDAIADEDLHVAVAGATMPNDASDALHRRFEFELVGVMHDVGRKFDRYWDVAWYQKRLS